MRIRFLGATRSVTGSCYLLEINNNKILIDCGMFQGKDAEEKNRAPFPFKPHDIDSVILTHAHIDHIGLVPRLVKEGFRGKIITTHATMDLARIMLSDSASLQERDAEWLKKKNLSFEREPILPLYTIEDVRRCLPLFEGKPYSKAEDLGKGLRYRFRDGGHVLGSAIVELWYKDSELERKAVFSGDIGRKGNPIVRDPEIVEEADIVVVESTYGNRLHKGLKETIDEFVEAIKMTFKRGGNVPIPSFALGRVQDILYILNNLVRGGRLYNIHIYLDSPLAEDATKVYITHPECFDEEAYSLFINRFDFKNILKIHFTKTTEESMAINNIRSGAIIIAGSGMCEGGRIRHHLKHNLWREECSVIFAGFQAMGTLGRHIVDGAKKIHLFGEEIDVKAKIYTLGGFSAHGDKKELLGWLEGFKTNPKVFVVHGEDKSSLEFSRSIKEGLDLEAYVPEIREVVEDLD